LASTRLIDKVTREFGPIITVKVHEEEDGVSRSRYKHVWFGLAAGATYSIDENFFAQARINYKPSDLIKANVGDTEGTSSLVFQLSIGYFFN